MHSVFCVNVFNTFGFLNGKWRSFDKDLWSNHVFHLEYSQCIRICCKWILFKMKYRIVCLVFFLFFLSFPLQWTNDIGAFFYAQIFFIQWIIASLFFSTKIGSEFFICFLFSIKKIYNLNKINFFRLKPQKKNRSKH